MLSNSATIRNVPFNVDLASIGIELTEEQKSWDPTRQKHELGVRIGYGMKQSSPDGKKFQVREVITNYVKILKRPRIVGVYELKIVRRTGEDRKEELVKNKTEKKAIFEQLKLQPGYENLGRRQDYVTDYDLIWAVSPLFQVGEDRKATPQATQMFPVRHPHTHAPITFESVTISWTKSINASQDPLSLLRSSNASIDASDDGAVLIRGINAFMTQHARDNMDTQHYASTAANRFFLIQAPHEKHLDRSEQQTMRAFRGFSVSARPGVDEMYLNIHVGASPFLENLSIQKLLKNFRATGTSVYRCVTVSFANSPSHVTHARSHAHVSLGESQDLLVISNIDSGDLSSYVLPRSQPCGSAVVLSSLRIVTSYDTSLYTTP